ncbi:MAG TPA: trypsin-like peptidase domain-containing protein [Verrucomicrobiae bacterium]|nr:trypsin-like peptidase domain-containing protein [Verrucomicrobiae bacterium]
MNTSASHFTNSQPVRWLTIGLALFLTAASPALYAAATPAAASNGDIDLARRLESAFEKVADQMSPSVVVITTSSKIGGAAESTEGDDGDNSQQFEGTPFEFFFKHLPQGHPRNIDRQGSGIILRKDGYILTNQHVVDGADTITVRLKDGTEYKDAKVIGTDDHTDIAVIKVDAKDLPAAKFANSDEVKVGQWAIAIGAPYELDYSFTVGFVSAKGRPPMGDPGIVATIDYIQTDAAINPGNSGGPLCDIEGRVIGINTLIRGLSRGIGFAVPINVAMDSAEKLIKDGKVTRPWIGISIEALSENKELAEWAKPLKDGVVVREIHDGTPAKKSTLKPADIIVAVDGVAVKAPRDLQRQILRKEVGQKVMLDVVRAGKTVQVALQTGEMPDTVQYAAHEHTRKPKAESAFGLTVQTLTKDLGEQLKLEDAAEGVVVVNVADGSAAQQKGLQRGDVITEVDRAPVHSAEDFKTAIDKIDPQKGVLLYVQRGGTSTFVVLKDSK